MRVSRQNPLGYLSLLDRLPVTDRYLIAVSGGRDSIALLHLLTERGFDRLIVCHLNHQLRGRAAAADARFVASSAERLGLLLETAEVDVAAFARERKLSIETAARAARYAFFVQAARRRRCPLIFLAHHADDVVETFLFNLFRGAGLAGLASLREESTHRVGRTELHLLRPLLPVWREQIDAYVKSNRIDFREDTSNRQGDPMRNRLRNSLIPRIEKELARKIRKTIWRTATIAADDDIALSGMLPPGLAESERIPVKALRALPVGLQRRAIQGWLLHHEVSEIGFELIESVRTLLEASAHVAKVNLPRARYVRRQAGKLFVE